MDTVASFTEIPRDRLEFTFKTNILAYFSLAQKAIEHMKPGSAIINTASIQGYNPKPAILDYATTKVITYRTGLD